MHIATDTLCSCCCAQHDLQHSSSIPLDSTHPAVHVLAGFFYVSGHGISAEPLFEAVRSLFALPEPDKAALDARLSPLHRGYTGLGGSHNCVPEESCVVGPDRKESYLLGEPAAANGRNRCYISILQLL
jgi:hypothetical protein